jgi:hypothetical protein
MYGFQDLASQQQQRFWFYTGTISGSFQTWNKPPGISFINIICVGGAGGGGGGSARRPGVSTIGATGGATGAMTTITLPSFGIPDTLYILPGYGGLGGRGGESGSIIPGGSGASLGLSGTSGTPSYVCFYPNTGSGYVLSIANGGGGGLLGQTGNSTATAGVGAASTAFPTAQFGLRNSLNGVAYVASSGNGTLSATYRTMFGGGNPIIINTTNGSAGALAPAGDMFATITGGASEGAAGSPGTMDMIKFISYGGTAGFSSVTQDGGLSGGGGLGSGGAGGAYGNLTGSYGGKGGDGFIIITCG